MLHTLCLDKPNVTSQSTVKHDKARYFFTNVYERSRLREIEARELGALEGVGANRTLLTTGNNVLETHLPLPRIPRVREGRGQQRSAG